LAASTLAIRFRVQRALVHSKGSADGRDQIMVIDGQSVLNKAIKDVKQMLVGPPGLFVPPPPATL